MFSGTFSFLYANDSIQVYPETGNKIYLKSVQDGINNLPPSLYNYTKL